MTNNRYQRGLKSLGAMAKDAALQARAKAIEEYWPIIERVCRERVGPAALHVALDDERLVGIVRKVYPSLPLALRLFVDEPKFISFCLTNRDRFLLVTDEAGRGTSDRREPNPSSA